MILKFFSFGKDVNDKKGRYESVNRKIDDFGNFMLFFGWGLKSIIG